MTHTQKSTCFLLPWLGFSYGDLVKNGFKTTYLDVDYLDTNYGDNIILSFEKDTDFIKTLENTPYFSSKHILEDEIHMVFTFTDFAKSSIVRPFIQGKYSLIDRDYVDKYFKNGLPESENVNYQVLTKSPILKKYWEYVLSIPERNRMVTLADDAEVWSTPDQQQETFKTYVGSNKAEV